MKKNLFRSRLFLCAPAAFCLCATLLCACSAQGNAVPASVHEQALAQLKAQDAELQALTEQVAELKAALADAQRAAALEDTRTEREKRLAAGLQQTEVSARLDRRQPFAYPAGHPGPRSTAFQQRVALLFTHCHADLTGLG